MNPLAITACTATSALGHGCAAHVERLRAGRTGLRANDFSRVPLACRIGRVDGVEEAALPPRLAAWDCRNNRLAWLGLGQDGFLDRVRAARARYGAARVGVLLGTSTASIGATEDAYRRLDAAGGFPADMQRPALHTPHSLAAFAADALELRGPCLTLSTACSSGAKAFASAARLIALDVIDAALVGGVDTLCASVLFGFHALELVAEAPCRPFDRDRDGISIGEAAAFALVERAETGTDAPQLLGYGESSDAYHMSTPDPAGAGAEAAVRAALARAGVDAADVDYVNLHGTASVKNDAMEAALVSRLYPPHARVSSTKGCTGHTLGAAGGLEAVIALLALTHGFVPGNIGAASPDPACGPQFAWRPESRPVRIALSHSFGFGGNNACLAFGAAGIRA